MPENTSKRAIGQRLKATRIALGYAEAQEFGRVAGIAQNTYSQLETGKNFPSLANALKLCHAYDLSLDWIYRGVMTGLPYGLARILRRNHGA